MVHVRDTEDVNTCLKEGQHSVLHSFLSNKGDLVAGWRGDNGARRIQDEGFEKEWSKEIIYSI